MTSNVFLSERGTEYRDRGFEKLDFFLGFRDYSTNLGQRGWQYIYILNSSRGLSSGSITEPYECICIRLGFLDGTPNWKPVYVIHMRHFNSQWNYGWLLEYIDQYVIHTLIFLFLSCYLSYSVKDHKLLCRCMFKTSISSIAGNYSSLAEWDPDPNRWVKLSEDRIPVLRTVCIPIVHLYS